jgi:asparagine synthetase A
MSENEITSFLENKYPSMTGLFKIWNESQLKLFELSSVGIAIGHANFRKVTGDKSQLKIWVN